jgi:hypothetical protein
MLATRLRELEAAGVVGRSAAEPKSYTLTERGQALRPVLQDLAVWGLGQLGKHSRDEPFDPRWLTIPISGLFRPERAAGLDLTVRFVLEGEEILLRIDDGQLTMPTEVDRVDVTVTGPPDALAAAVTQPGSRAARRLDVTGDPSQAAVLSYVLGLSDDPPPR